MPKPPLSRGCGRHPRARSAGEHHLGFVGRKTDARVAARRWRHMRVAALDTLTVMVAALGGVAHRIGDEVGRGLADHVRIAAHAHAALRTGVVLKLEARVGRRRPRCVATMPLMSVADLEHARPSWALLAVLQAGKLQDGESTRRLRRLNLGVDRRQGAPRRQGTRRRPWPRPLPGWP